MSMHRSSAGKIKSFVVFSCLILIIGLIAYAFIIDNNDKVLDKEDIQQNISSDQNVDRGYSYVSSYLKDYGIRNINSYKINYIEMELEAGFYKQLPSERDLALSISELYLEYFYDSIDKEDKAAVTDAVINCFIASLGDPYAYYRNTEEFKEYISSLQGTDSFVGIGVMVNSETLEVLMVYKDSGAEAAGIRRGDFIYAVEGTTIEESSSATLTDMLRGEEGTTVNITVKRGEQLIDVVAVRKALSEQTVTYEIDENNIGYIYVTQFLRTTSGQFKAAVDYCVNNKADAIIIDMRYNPGGLLTSVVEMVDYLIPDAPNRMITSYTHSGEKIVYNTTDGHGINLPIAVLCNGGTASAAELFTASMRDFADQGVIKSVIVGENTYGKGVLQTSVDLYDYSGITYTVGYYNPPCDVNFDGIGVAPDIEVAEVTGKDAPYEVASEEVMKLVYSINGTA